MSFQHLQNLERGIRTERAVINSISISGIERAQSLSRLGHYLFTRYQQDPSQFAADLNNSIEIGQQALELAAGEAYSRSLVSHSLAHRFRVKFENTKDVNDIDQALALEQDAIWHVPAHLTNMKLQEIQALGDHLSFREGILGDVNDAVRSLEQYALLVGSITRQHSGLDVRRLWNNIANSSEAVMNNASKVEDIGSLIASVSIILDASDKDDLHVARIHQYAIQICLAEVLKVRYSRNHTTKDLDRATNLLSTIQGEIEPQHRYSQPLQRSILLIHQKYIEESMDLKSKYMSDPDRDTLDQALKLAEKGQIFIHEHDNEEENRAVAANNRGRILKLSYDERSNECDLKLAKQMAIIALQTSKSIELRHGRIECLASYMAKLQKFEKASPDLLCLRNFFRSNFAGPESAITPTQLETDEAYFLQNFGQGSGSSTALDESLKIYESITTGLMRNDAEVWENYAVAAVQRWKMGGVSTHLDLATNCARTALSVDLQQGKYLSMRYVILGNILAERFQIEKTEELITEAISMTMKGLELSPKSSVTQMNLGNKYKWRHEAFGLGEDIVQAVHFCEKATESDTLDKDARGLCVNNYQLALTRLFLHTHNPDHLDQAIAQGEKLLTLIPRSQDITPESAIWASNHAANLYRRAGTKQKSDAAGALSDVEESIRLTELSYNAAIRLKIQERRAAMANNLCMRYTFRAILDEAFRLEHLGRAVEYGRESLQLSARTHPAYSYRSRNLGKALEEMEDCGLVLESVLDIYEQSFATESAVIGDRFASATELVVRLQKEGKIERLDQVLRNVVDLIPRLRLSALRRTNQQQRVKLASELTCMAAAAALSVGSKYQDAGYEALRRLELGRGMIFGSLFDRREENQDLQERSKEHYEELKRLEADLEAASSESAVYNADEQESSRAADERLRISRNLDAVVEEIRSMEGFERFRLPPVKAELLKIARSAPIVVINPTTLRSDALIIRGSGIQVLCLTKLTLEDARTQVTSLHSALDQAANVAAKAAARPGRYAGELRRKHGEVNKAMRRLCPWLWTSIVEPVLMSLQLIGDTLPSQLPRIRWIGCDVLSMCPLHAAGLYNSWPERSTMQYCVSSYATTLKAILFSERPRQRSISSAMQDVSLDKRDILAVPAPSVPGTSTLSTGPELAALKSALPAEVVYEEIANVTRDEVLSRLKSTTVAHFACHGYADVANPSASRLVLPDYKTAPLTANRIGTLNLTEANLAYISACQSALSRDQGLANEGITIASAFQLAGFPSVVGTLWQALDSVAIVMTGYFYAALYQAQTLDPGKTFSSEDVARALHVAVSQTRAREEYRGDFFAWAAWIHVG
ncbi:MAG: hypothetical protein Q9227_002337 [Pyrenula ochraceoflavens]